MQAALLINALILCSSHADVVSFLLHNFRKLRIDYTNSLGFTALMKAAIQGRTKCAKLLLFAGKLLSLKEANMIVDYVDNIN